MKLGNNLVGKNLSVSQIIAHQVLDCHLYALFFQFLLIPVRAGLASVIDFKQNCANRIIIHQIVISYTPVNLGRSNNILDDVVFFIRLWDMWVYKIVGRIARLGVLVLKQTKIADKVNIQVFQTNGPVDEVIFLVKGINSPNELFHKVKAF